jgi:hypothetical protein
VSFDIYSCTDDAGRRILPQELLQMLARGLHPDDVLLRRAQRDPLLQDPLLAAVKGEGQLQPPHPDSPGQEELYATTTICKSATPYVESPGRSATCYYYSLFQYS